MLAEDLGVFPFSLSLTSFSTASLKVFLNKSTLCVVASSESEIKKSANSTGKLLEANTLEVELTLFSYSNCFLRASNSLRSSANFSASVSLAFLSASNLASSVFFCH